MDLFSEKDTPQAECAISEGKTCQNMAWLIFMDWVISKANEWENYSN